MNSGIVSEKHLTKKRRVRQGEWEKIRQSNSSLGAPEESRDHGVIFDNLEDEKQKNQLGYGETNRLKNKINDGMEEFLEVVDQKKLESHHRKECKGKQDLIEYRNKLEKKKELALGQKIQSEIQPVRLNIDKRFELRPQQQLQSDPSKEKIDCFSNKINDEQKDVNYKNDENLNECCNKKRKRSECDSDGNLYQFQSTVLTCIGILPGLGTFIDSSGDSDQSCSSDSENNENVKYDLVGRRIVFKSKEDTG